MLKIKKVNIGSEDNRKFANIGDYWDEETIAKIIDLLHGLQDLSPDELQGNEGDSRIFGRNENSAQTQCKTGKTVPIQTKYVL